MVKALAILVAVLALYAGVQTSRLHSAQLAQATATTEASDARAAAERAARATNSSIVDVLFEADVMYRKGVDDAQAVSDRDAAALRAGTLRLRREWAACETGRLADGAAAERRTGEAAERRSALALEIVRVGAECDAKERSLIAAYDGARDRINRGAPE